MEILVGYDWVYILFSNKVAVEFQSVGWTAYIIVINKNIATSRFQMGVWASGGLIDTDLLDQRLSDGES